MKKIILVLFMCLVMIGCKKEENKNQEVENFKVELNVSVEDNCKWNHKIEDESIIKYVTDKYVPFETEMFGYSGAQVYELKGIKEGKTDIIFECLESNNVIFNKTYTFVVDKDLNIAMK